MVNRSNCRLRDKMVLPAMVEMVLSYGGDGTLPAMVEMMLPAMVETMTKTIWKRLMKK